jgi:hypothetical protein
MNSPTPTVAAQDGDHSTAEDHPGYCECDNTHEQNDTVCRFCWSLGRRKPGDPEPADTRPRCAWCNDPFQMNGSFCSSGCEEACNESRLASWPDLVAALERIKALEPQAEDHPDHGMQMARAFGRAQGIAMGALALVRQ